MTHVRAVPTVQIDEAAVRVTEWRLAPNAVIDWHRHEYPYVVVPIPAAEAGRENTAKTRPKRPRG